MRRRFDVEVPVSQIGASIGTKEFVATLPQWLQLRTPSRDTVLVSGDRLSHLRDGGDPRRDVVRSRCAATPTGQLDLESIDPADAERALVLWVNSPSNPTGALDDLDAAATWGRAHEIPVFSDECYVEFTWSGRGRTILESGLDGLVAVHSLSKRSNLAGVRVGFYAGDAELVSYLQEIRKHVGMMVPGPAQAAGIAALDDDEHVALQRERYRNRLELLADVVSAWSQEPVRLPDGAFYLWIPVTDGWDYAERLARDGGALVSPGEFYGPTVHASSVWPWYNLTTGSNSSPIAWRPADRPAISDAPPSHPPPVRHRSMSRSSRGRGWMLVLGRRHPRGRAGRCRCPVVRQQSAPRRQRRRLRPRSVGVRDDARLHPDR